VPHLQRPDQRRTLLLLLLAALAVRLVWWALYIDIIENEGVEYARLAWNWFHGRGYVSIFGGNHILFPPLYPLLIGLTALVAGSEESAARLVSVVAGVAMVGAVYGLARRTFNDRVAVLAGGLAALHPLLAGLAASTYSEALYLSFYAHAALAAVRAFRERSARWAAACGLLAGLAYLTRPEGVFLALAFGPLLLAAGLLARHGWRTSLLHASLVGLLLLLVSAPYAWYLSRIAGGFRWEGKSAINGFSVMRITQGMGLSEANRGLGPNAEPEGPYLRFSDQHALLAYPPEGAPGVLATVMEAPVTRAQTIASRIRYARWLGSPMLLVLIAVGLVGTVWWKSRLFEGLVLLALGALPIMALMTLQWTWTRYFMPLLPAGVIWAAAGAEGIASGFAAVAARIGLKGSLPRLLNHGLAGVLLVAVVAQSARYVTTVLELSQTRHSDIRAAGEWIRRDYQADIASRRPVIASIGLALAHYAEGETLYLPYADSERALKYLRAAGPDYVAIRESEGGSLPYLSEWTEREPPDECAERVTLPAEVAAHFAVWRWKCRAGQPAPRDSVP
jgi:4-amino-4-deoxy-L-arabinose transferase-like glycosyltransferase